MKTTEITQGSLMKAMLPSTIVAQNMGAGTEAGVKALRIGIASAFSVLSCSVCGRQFLRNRFYSFLKRRKRLSSQDISIFALIFCWQHSDLR